MKRYHIYTGIISAICVVLCLMTIFVFKIKDMTAAKGEINDFNTGWTIVRPDGSSSEIEELPYSEPSKAYEVFAIENTIPEEYRGKTISFLSADKELRVFVDGNVIYEFGKEDKRLFGNTPGSITNFIELPSNFEEGKIRIESVSPYNGYASNFLNITIGDKDVIELMLIRKNLINYLFCMTIMFCAILLFIFELIDVFSKQPFSGVSYLGGICSLGSIYHAIETKTLNIFFGNQTLYSVIVFLVIMIMPVYLCMYYLCSYDEKFSKRIKINLYASYVNIILQVCVQIFGIADFMIIAPLSHAMIMITIINLVSITVQVVHKTYKDEGIINRKLLVESIGVAAILIGSATDIIRFYISPVGDMGKYGRLGMLMFSILTFLVHLRSISSRYVTKVEENVSLMTKLLEKAKAENKAKSVFLANMSHEIRTPMNSIMGFAEILLKQKMNEEQEEYVANIRESSRSLLNIINDILDISKIESGKIELVESYFSTSKLLNSVMMEIKPLADKKGLEFAFDIGEDLPTTFLGDEIRFREILVNVLNNAVKYTNFGTVTLAVKNNSIIDDVCNCSIRISDTGIGISEEYRETIFDAFEQADQLKNKGIEGTGLGLSIVKGYVTLMGGTISVESELGHGSTFAIDIPLKVIDATPVGKIAINKTSGVESEIGDIQIEDRTALVVDDSIVNLKVIRKILENYGLKVDDSSSGEKAVEMCQNKHYDMIFMDQMMPGMDGVTAMKKIREIAGYESGSKNKIFVLTANAIHGVEAELLSEGFDEYFSKPIDFKAIEDALTKYW